MKIYVQLNFGGNCEEAFRYYEKHLGGKIEMIMHANQAPVDGPLEGNAVVHARMRIADTAITGNDVPAEFFQPIRSSYLYLEGDSQEHAEKLWAALSDGGNVTIPWAETFFATRFGQVRDKFGVLWSVLHMKPMA